MGREQRHRTILSKRPGQSRIRQPEGETAIGRAQGKNVPGRLSRKAQRMGATNKPRPKVLQEH